MRLVNAASLIAR